MKQKNIGHDFPVRRAIIITLVVFAGYSIWVLVIWQGAWNPGMFGDAFGVVTSFCSILALIGIFLTYMKETRQLEVLMADRADSVVQTVRGEIADTFQAMLETKRMIIAAHEAEQIRLERNPPQFAEDLDSGTYSTSTARSLYGVQNAWLLLCLERLAKHPDLLDFIVGYLLILNASIGRAEVEALRKVVGGGDLSLLQLIRIGPQSIRANEAIGRLQQHEDYWVRWKFDERLTKADMKLQPVLSKVMGLSSDSTEQANQ